MSSVNINQINTNMTYINLSNLLGSYPKCAFLVNFNKIANMQSAELSKL